MFCVNSKSEFKLITGCGLNSRLGLASRLLVLVAAVSWAFSSLPVSAQSGSGTAFFKQVSEQFKAWDKDGDGVLSTNELDLAIGDVKVTGGNAAAVAALKRAQRSGRYSLPPFTLENIHVLATNASATNFPNLGRMYAEGLRQITNAPRRELFASGSPKLETIHQGKLGNCFTLAPLGALVHHDPHQVERMFTALDDGTFRVALGKQSVVVAPPTDAELAMTSSSEGSGVWVNLYEKAVGQARNDAKPLAEQSSSAIDALARGGSAGIMLAFITGHEISRFSFKFAKDPAVSAEEQAAKIKELKTKLMEADRERVLMTCGTIKPTIPGITPNHAYAVLAYNANTAEVQVWDPHGDDFKPKGEAGAEHGYPRKDGRYWIPVTEWVKQFSGMAFEVRPATTSL